MFNRAIQTQVLFDRPADYEAFLRIIRQALERHPMRLMAYSLMPNHWHLILWPGADDCLSPFMQWLTVTHAKQWREATGTTGRGALYQGRFKAVAVQRDGHFLTACAYVERNALGAKLVDRAEDWPWTSASPLALAASRPALTPWPVAKPEDWSTRLNAPEARELDELRKSIRRGLPFGAPGWRAVAMSRLRWRTGRPIGRPPGSRSAADGSVPFLPPAGLPTVQATENLALLTGGRENELPLGGREKDSRDLGGARVVTGASSSRKKRLPRPEAAQAGREVDQERTPET